MTQIHSPQTDTVDAAPASHVNVNRIEITERALSILALIVATLALGAYLALPVMIDAKVQSGIAEAKASMQQQVSDAKAAAGAAKVDARVALDQVEGVRDQLGQKGIRITLSGH